MVLAITIVVTLTEGVVDSSADGAELDAAGSPLGSSFDDVEFPNCLLTYLGK